MKKKLSSNAGVTLIEILIHRLSLSKKWTRIIEKKQF